MSGTELRVSFGQGLIMPITAIAEDKINKRENDILLLPVKSSKNGYIKKNSNGMNGTNHRIL